MQVLETKMLASYRKMQVNSSNMVLREITSVHFTQNFQPAQRERYRNARGSIDGSKGVIGHVTVHLDTREEYLSS